MNPDQIDCIVRFHDPRRLYELDRCVFSLIGQQYRPLRIIIVTQRFTEKQLNDTLNVIAPFKLLPCAPSIIVKNWEHSVHKDARSELMNLGMSLAEGRYLGFLDYDDLLYPEAYPLLVDRLINTNTSIAFASVRLMYAEMYPEYIYTVGTRKKQFTGKNLWDLYRSNFCPIHSYLLDRKRIQKDALHFCSSLAWEEDYEFLLKICAIYPSDFGLLGTVIGDYYFKDDGSNTIPIDQAQMNERRMEYEAAKKIIEQRKKELLLSDAVKKELGISDFEGSLCISDALGLYAKCVS
jgi:hypothetical protein